MNWRPMRRAMARWTTVDFVRLDRGPKVRRQLASASAMLRGGARPPAHTDARCAANLSVHNTPARPLVPMLPGQTQPLPTVFLVHMHAHANAVRRRHFHSTLCCEACAHGFATGDLCTCPAVPRTLRGRSATTPTAAAPLPHTLPAPILFAWRQALTSHALVHHMCAHACDAARFRAVRCWL